MRPFLAAHQSMGPSAVPWCLLTWPLISSIIKCSLTLSPVRPKVHHIRFPRVYGIHKTFFLIVYQQQLIIWYKHLDQSFELKSQTCGRTKQQELHEIQVGRTEWPKQGNDLVLSKFTVKYSLSFVIYHCFLCSVTQTCPWVQHITLRHVKSYLRGKFLVPL